MHLLLRLQELCVWSSTSHQQQTAVGGMAHDLLASYDQLRSVLTAMQELSHTHKTLDSVMAATE
jgi:hypothetical protein